jgi:hypothetical protein
MNKNAGFDRLGGDTTVSVSDYVGDQPLLRQCHPAKKEEGQ